MKQQIVKVTYIDGSESEVKEFSPLIVDEIFKELNWFDRYKKQREFKRQFFKLEDEILNALDEDNLKDYVKWNFDLVEEEEHEEKEIDDFSDSELLAELKCRNIPGSNTILTEDFFPRFMRIVEKENSVLLDNLLTEFEKKLSL